LHQARDVLVLVCAIEQDSRVDRPALRRGELLGLHWEDIGLNAGTLEVVQTLRRVGVWPDWQENGLMFPTRIGTPMEPDNLPELGPYPHHRRAAWHPDRGMRHTCVSLLLHLKRPGRRNPPGRFGWSELVVRGGVEPPTFRFSVGSDARLGMAG